MHATAELHVVRPAVAEGEAPPRSGPVEGFWLCDLEGRLLDVSASYCELLGHPREALLALGLAGVEAGGPGDAVRRRLARVVERGGDRFEVRQRRRDGQLVELEVVANHFEGEGKVFAFLRDVTSRRREEARRQADERRLGCLERLARTQCATLRELLDQALEESLTLTGSTLGYIYWYDEDRKEFTLHSWSTAVMSACSIPNLQRVYQLEKTGVWGEAVRQRRPIMLNDFAAPHPHKKGYPEGHAALTRFLTVPVEVDGRIVAVVGAANKPDPYDDEDVRQLRLFMDAIWHRSGREQAEEVRSKLSAVVEQGPSGVAIFDAAGLVEYVNPRFLELSGLAREAVLGQPVDRVLPPSLGAAEHRQGWGELLAGRAWRGEGTRHHGGTETHEVFTILPIRNPTGAITHFAAVFEDISERRRLEQALLHAQKLESLGTLAGGVAHDFNNILTGLVGIAGVVRDELGQAHPLRGDLDEILQLVNRATALTRSLLAFGRRQASRPRREELGDVVDGVARLLRRVIGEQVRLVLRPADEELPVLADRGQLEQVLTNLATNARDAMPRGGELAVSVAAGEVDEALAREHRVKPGRYAIISVQDQGTGMDEATRSRIFDPFFTTKDVGKGTGLGLSIVYGIVRQHGGFVRVESRPGAGSRFEVWLPRQAAAPEDAADEAPVAAARGRGETVLLAEDDPTVRGVWASLLRRHGYRVITAEDGEQAVAAFRAAAGGVGLCLLDVTMPRKSGVEAYAEIRALDPRVRILFASGYETNRMDEGSAASQERLLAKPLAPADLLAAVRERLDGRA
jgi:PAS domain S-box-containing protein